jgi:cell division transport system permease protein
VRALGYALAEAGASLWRGRRSGALAIITIAAGLAVLGLFLVAAGNLQHLVQRWSAAAELSVYLDDEVSAADRIAIEQVLDASAIVEDRVHVSKAEAYSRFRAEFADLAPAAESLAGNPFPASYEIGLRPDVATGSQVEELAARLARLSGVIDVRYDQQWLARLLLVIRAVEVTGLAIVLVLVMAAALTVGNVVRLAAYTRRDELEIMQLVGAPYAYVRGPLVAEGVVQGGIGAVVAIALLAAGFAAGRLWWNEAIVGAFGGEGLRFLPWPVIAVLLAGGMGVGCLGGIIAARSVREGS